MRNEVKSATPGDGKKIGVVLSGCGVMDGSEIHESVLTLLAISKNGAEAVCMAPNIEQVHVINHLTGNVAPQEKRNVLVESARIARAQIQDIKNIKASELDALAFPGGYGAAKNLCDFAVKGENAQPNPEVARLVREMLKAQKPMAFLCISPALCASIFRNTDVKPTLTIGTDTQTAEKLEKMGAKHQTCSAVNFVVDSQHKLVSTPAYMLAESLSELYEGIEKTITKLCELCLSPSSTPIGR